MSEIKKQNYTETTQCGPMKDGQKAKSIDKPNIDTDSKQSEISKKDNINK